MCVTILCSWHLFYDLSILVHCYTQPPTWLQDRFSILAVSIDIPDNHHPVAFLKTGLSLARLFRATPSRFFSDFSRCGFIHGPTHGRCHRQQKNNEQLSHFCYHKPVVSIAFVVLDSFIGLNDYYWMCIRVTFSSPHVCSSSAINQIFILVPFDQNHRDIDLVGALC